MEKNFIVITVARQIAGDYIFVKVEKGFKQAGAADALVQQFKSKFVSLDGKPIVQKITTPQGEANCFCEVGAFEVDID